MTGRPHHHQKVSLDLSSKPSKTLFKELLKQVESAYENIHKNGYKVEDLKEYRPLIEATNSIFRKALSAGVRDNVIPSRMMTSLENDVFLFSALKTHAQLFEASNQLLTSDGKVKSFQQFSRDVEKIKKNYNQNYLQAEYNFAVASAQQAANWAEIEHGDEDYLLQYRTAEDDRVRDEHQALAGTTLPSTDAFWDEFYPPNGWNCRCVAVEVRNKDYKASDSKKAIAKGKKATESLDKNNKNRLEIFRFNPGKEKVIFPPNHPYNKLQGVDYVKDLKYRDLVFNKPLEKQYSSVYNSSNGGKVLVHDLADIKAPRVKSDDYIDRIEVAKAFAKQGHTVKVLPVVDSKDIEIRKVVLRGYSHKTANPDFLIDGKYMDLKRPESIRKILKNANHAALKQESIAVLTDKFIDKKISKEVLESRMNDILSDKNKGNYTFDEVYFINKGKLLKFKRQ